MIDHIKRPYVRTFYNQLTEIEATMRFSEDNQLLSYSEVFEDNNYVVGRYYSFDDTFVGYIKHENRKTSNIVTLFSSEPKPSLDQALTEVEKYLEDTNLIKSIPFHHYPTNY